MPNCWANSLGTAVSVAAEETQSSETTDVRLRRTDRALSVSVNGATGVVRGATKTQFHIHVNPFQIVSIRNADGLDVIDAESPAHDPDYAGLSGQWRDSMTLKSGYQAVLRTRYERFIGDFVLHCHIVQHGDQGMMQNLRIVPPSSRRDR